MPSMRCAACGEPLDMTAEQALDISRLGGGTVRHTDGQCPRDLAKAGEEEAERVAERLRFRQFHCTVEVTEGDETYAKVELDVEAMTFVAAINDLSPRLSAAWEQIVQNASFAEIPVVEPDAD